MSHNTAMLLHKPPSLPIRIIKVGANHVSRLEKNFGLVEYFIEVDFFSSLAIQLLPQQTAQTVQIPPRYQQPVNEVTQLQQTVQQQTLHQSQAGHHLQAQTTQIHTHIQHQQQTQQPPQQQQQQQQQQQPNVQQQNAQQQQPHHQAQAPHPHMQQIQQQPPQLNPQLVATSQPTPSIYANQYQIQQHIVPQQIAAALPVQQPAYQKRERKPLLIVDPLTKQPVNTTVATAAAATATTDNNNHKIESKDVLTKSQTQPCISSIAQQPASNLSNPVAASTVSLSTPTTTTTIVAAPASIPAVLKQPEVAPTTTTTSNSSQTAPSAAAVTATVNNKPEPASSVNNSNENKKQATQEDFALKVLKRKQENDLKSKQTTSAPTPSPTPAAAAATVAATPVAAPVPAVTQQPPRPPITAAGVVAGLAAPSKMNESAAKPVAEQPKVANNVAAKPAAKPVEAAVVKQTTATPVAEPVCAAPSPAPGKPISYSNIVAQTVPKNAIPIARQPPPASITVTSTTYTNSNLDSAGKTGLSAQASAKPEVKSAASKPIPATVDVTKATKTPEPTIRKHEPLDFCLRILT